MHITPNLTPAAMNRWLLMSSESQEIILSNIWCSPCNAVHGIRGAVGDLHPSGDIILYGNCMGCGGKVCRVIETGESLPLS